MFKVGDLCYCKLLDNQLVRITGLSEHSHFGADLYICDDDETHFDGRNLVLVNINEDTIFTINFEGYATFYHDKDNAFISTNSVKDFPFRDYKNCDETDGTDFWGVDNEEFERIYSAFVFKKWDV